MKYTARHQEVEAIALTVAEPGPTLGEGYFALRTAAGNSLALIDRESFLTLYERVGEEVPSESTPGKENPAVVKKAVKKVAEKKLRPRQYDTGPRIPDTAPTSSPVRPAHQSVAPDPQMKMGEALMICAEKGLYSTVDLAKEVEKIRPGTNLASLYAAVGDLIRKGMLARDKDSKLVVCR